MSNNIFLNQDLYNVLFSTLRKSYALKEKELQIVFGNVLHNHFKIKRIYHEAKYRYFDISRNYYSDHKLQYCESIERKKFAKECDVRLLNPPSWIELKLNSKINSKDMENLFTISAQNFTPNESKYSIYFWTNASVVSIQKEISKFQKTERDLEYSSKIISLNNGIIVAVFYRIGTA